MAGVIVAAMNHLIRNESWAQERLRPFAGQQALIQLAGIDVYLILDGDGIFQTGSAEQAATVTVILPPDTPFRFFTDRKSIFQSAKLSGSVDFAEALAFVFRNLQWDVEADLARVVGDIPVRRLEMVRRGFLTQTTGIADRFMRNLTEYASEDSDFVANRRDIEGFIGAVDILRDDVSRLEKRLKNI